MTDAAAGFATWRRILEVARSAPSPHNVQPWRVRLLSDDEAELFIDGTRTLPNEDHTGSFLLSAMGMFLEAIELVAAQDEMRVEAVIPESATWYAEWIGDRNNKGLILFARLQLIAAPDVSLQVDPALLLARQTSRINLRPAPVPEVAVATLAQLAVDWGHRYTHIEDTLLIEEMLAQNIRAVFADMNVAAYHDEITEWFRFTDRSAEEHKDGLDWRCMNLSRLEFWMSARMAKVLLFPPTAALLKRRYRRQLGNVPAVGILSGDFFNVESAVQSGRFLLRFWLEVTRLGLYLHPYGNMVTNEGAAAWLEGKTGVPKAWLVFKLGFSDAPPRSFRRSVDEIFVAKDGTQ